MNPDYLKIKEDILIPLHEKVSESLKESITGEIRKKGKTEEEIILFRSDILKALDSHIASFLENIEKIIKEKVNELHLLAN